MTRRKAILSVLLAPFALKAAAKEASLKPIVKPVEVQWWLNPKWEHATHTFRFYPRDYHGNWKFIGGELWHDPK